MRKLTKAKIVLALITIFMLLFPFYMLNINFSKYLINSVIVLDSKMVVISAFFLIYLVLYIISNKSKKNKEVSGKDDAIDTLVDQSLIDCALIILSSYGYINPVITGIVVIKHLSCNLLDINKANIKFETVILILGIILKMISNLPMEFINIALDEFFLIAGAILCFISIINGLIAFNKLSKKSDN